MILHIVSLIAITGIIVAVYKRKFIIHRITGKLRVTVYRPDKVRYVHHWIDPPQHEKALKLTCDKVLSKYQYGAEVVGIFPKSYQILKP
jgi:hypothetical protein